MNKSETIHLWIQKLVCLDLLYTLRTTAPMSWIKLQREKTADVKARRDRVRQRVTSLVARLDMEDSLNMEAMIPEFFASLPESLVAKDIKTSSALPNVALQYLQRIDACLGAVPNNLEKALAVTRALAENLLGDCDQEYEAMVYWQNELPDSAIRAVVQEWKEDRRRFIEHHRKDPFPISDVFWNSRDDHDVIDGVSRYRFMEALDIGEFSEAQSAIEAMVGMEIIRGVTGTEALLANITGDTSLGPSAFSLFLASRSPVLTTRIRGHVDIALTRLASEQFPEGYYLDYTRAQKLGKRVRYSQSVYLTAIAAVCLGRLARARWQVQRGRSSVVWLVAQQLQDGAWPAIAYVGSPVTPKPDFLTTLIAAEAIRINGDASMSRSLVAADQWIVAQQQPDGTWPDEGLPFPFVHLLTIEHLAQALVPRDNWTALPGVARGFLRRARELAAEDSMDAQQLAAVAAHQGLEALLYALLSVPAIHRPIYKDKARTMTIGLQAALTAFEAYLREKSMLAPEEQLPFGNDLRRLADIRDQVVHKGHTVDADELKKLLTAAMAFGREYAREFLHLTLD